MKDGTRPSVQESESTKILSIFTLLSCVFLGRRPGGWQQPPGKTLMTELRTIKAQVGTGPVDRRIGAHLRVGQLGTCPWHKDSTPSFGPYRRRDGSISWKCLAGCFVGDVIDFVMRFDSCTRSQALERLGAEPPTPPPTSKPKQPPPPFDSMEASGDLALDSDALSYLASRGVTPEKVPELSLGVGRFPKMPGRYITMPHISSGKVVRVKFRAIPPFNDDYKWRSWTYEPGITRLYARDSARPSGAIWITESELDCALLCCQHLNAISVCNAGHRLTADDRQWLKRFDYVLLAVDQDAAGQKCAARFTKELPNAVALRWATKDIGELFQSSPQSFHEVVKEIARTAIKSKGRKKC